MLYYVSSVMCNIVIFKFIAVLQLKIEQQWDSNVDFIFLYEEFIFHFFTIFLTKCPSHHCNHIITIKAKGLVPCNIKFIYDLHEQAIRIQIHKKCEDEDLYFVCVFMKIYKSSGIYLKYCQVGLLATICLELNL